MECMLLACSALPLLERRRLQIRHLRDLTFAGEVQSWLRDASSLWKQVHLLTQIPPPCLVHASRVQGQGPR